MPLRRSRFSFRRHVHRRPGPLGGAHTGVARYVTCAPTLSLLRSYVRAYHADLRRRLELD
jgi:hypothetical protein